MVSYSVKTIKCGQFIMGKYRDNFGSIKIQVWLGVSKLNIRLTLFFVLITTAHDEKKRTLISGTLIA